MAKVFINNGEEMWQSQLVGQSEDLDICVSMAKSLYEQGFCSFVQTKDDEGYMVIIPPPFK